MATIDPDLLVRVRGAAATVAALAARTEAERRLPPEAVSALASAGIFKLLVPRSYGGLAAPVPSMLAVLEHVAAADGAAGWCSMIFATTGLVSLVLDEAVAREIYAPDDAVSCGVFAAMGRAVRVDGGFRVSGRWPFASGCQHAAWLTGAAIVEGEPPLPSGAPHVHGMVFPARDVGIHDTWHVIGLCGTGSHDIEVTDVFVPAARSFSLSVDAPRRTWAAHRAPFIGVLGAAVAAVALGIARAALDGFIELAGTKRPVGAHRPLASRELVQFQLARAEARLRAGRAFLYAAVEDAQRLAAGDSDAPDSLHGRAVLRLAAAHAATEAAAAVDSVYELAGGTAVYTKHALQRQFRDLRAITQHIQVSATTTTLAGRILLDVPTEPSVL